MRDPSRDELQRIAHRVWENLAAKRCAGTDPYDGLNSRLLAPALRHSRLLRLAATISDDVGCYFATVTLINPALGVATAAAMYWLGMPNPLLWGMVAFVLNFIPYAGSAVTLALLTVVAVVSFDGLGKPLAVAGSYLVLTTIEGQIVQPILVGRRLDVSPLIVFLSLWVAGWLWGIAGVALAVPLLVTAKALGLGLGEVAPAESAAASDRGQQATRDRRDLTSA